MYTSPKDIILQGGDITCQGFYYQINSSWLCKQWKSLQSQKIAIRYEHTYLTCPSKMLVKTWIYISLNEKRRSVSKMEISCLGTNTFNIFCRLCTIFYRLHRRIPFHWIDSWRRLEFILMVNLSPLNCPVTSLSPSSSSI